MPRPGQDVRAGRPCHCPVTTWASNPRVANERNPSRRRTAGAVFRMVVAWFLIGSGLLVLPLPVPVGLLLIVVGVTILANDNRRLGAWVRRLRGRHPRFSARLQGLEPHAPGMVRRLLRRTDPAGRKTPADSGDESEP